MSTQKSDDFYKRLHAQLLDDTTWPSSYLYKFIVPTDADKIQAIYGIFDGIAGAVIDSKKSKKGTYTSVSITVTLQNPDAVIQKYKEVGEIEGVISL